MGIEADHGVSDPTVHMIDRSRDPATMPTRRVPISQFDGLAFAG